MNGLFVIVRRGSSAFAIQSSNLKVLLIEKILVGDSRARAELFTTRVNNAFGWRDPRIRTYACTYVRAVPVRQKSTHDH